LKIFDEFDMGQRLIIIDMIKEQIRNGDTLEEAINISVKNANTIICAIESKE